MMVFWSLMVIPATAAETVDAVWKEQEIDFAFLGLDVAYSCDAIKASLEMLLHHVGAADVEVIVPSCGGFKGAHSHHRIDARFSTLVPAGDGDVDIVKAAWSEVELGKRHPRSIDDGDCELLEHFQKYLLSAIEHEAIEGAAGCGAARRSSGNAEAEVLKPVQGRWPHQTDAPPSRSEPSLQCSELQA
jgi:hypothetical protein